MTTPWTPELVAELRRLWSQKNISTAAIGRRLGMTKNAILGKAHRLKLEGREEPAGPRKAREAPPPRQSKGIGCRFIEGDDYLAILARGGGNPFCSAPVSEPGGSWCAEHKAMVYGQPGKSWFLEKYERLTDEQQAVYAAARGRGRPPFAALTEALAA